MKINKQSVKMSKFRKIHKWLGIPLGIIIAIICFTGAILALQDEIISMANRDVVHVATVGDSVIPIDQLASKINLSTQDGATVSSLVISADKSKAYRFRLNDDDATFVYANQYTGEISTPRHQMRFFNTVRRLHRFLFDTRRDGDGIFWGKNIVGISTLLLAIIIITGIVVWWPKRGERLSHKLRIRCNEGFLKLNFDLHCNASIYVSIIVLAMALTGLTWSFTWYKSAVYTLFGVEAAETHSAHHSHHKEKNADDSTKLYKAWNNAYCALSTADAHGEITFNGKKAEVYLSDYGNMRAKDTYLLDKTGAIKEVKRYSDCSKEDRVKGWIATIHRGTFGGLTTKILWAIAALMGGMMPITGYVIWIRKLKRHHKSQQQKTNPKTTIS